MKTHSPRYIILALLLGGTSFFSATKSFAVDLFGIPYCLSEKNYRCFDSMKSIFEGEYWMISLFPVFILSENNPPSINAQQLAQMGYTTDEIADFTKDMNTLQNAMVQRNRKFTSTSEVKVWMQSFPLAPITRELMRQH